MDCDERHVPAPDAEEYRVSGALAAPGAFLSAADCARRNHGLLWFEGVRPGREAVRRPFRALVSRVERSASGTLLCALVDDTWWTHLEVDAEAIRFSLEREPA